MRYGGLIVVIVISIVLASLAFLDAANLNGWYFGSCISIAFNERGGMHELGHCKDYLSGWVSHTREWKNAVEGYVVGCKTFVNCDDEMIILKTYPGVGGQPMKRIIFWDYGGYTEAYAEVYAEWKMEGSIMPDVLLPFYEDVKQGR